MYFTVPDVDRCFAEFSGRGISPAKLPEATPWGTQEMLVVDPDGNRLRFASKSASAEAR